MDFHPLHPLQLLNGPTDSYVENVVSFVSKLQEDFDQGSETTYESQGSNDAARGPPHHRELEFQVGDYVLLSTRYIRFRNCPQKVAEAVCGTV